jgi:hypothetical protein
MRSRVRCAPALAVAHPGGLLLAMPQDQTHLRVTRVNPWVPGFNSMTDSNLEDIRQGAQWPTSRVPSPTRDS